MTVFISILFRTFYIILIFSFKTSIYFTKKILKNIFDWDVKVLKGEYICSLLKSLGPTYIKIGQVLSMRADILSKETSDQLTILQDKLNPINKRSIRKILEKEYKKPFNLIFEYFDFTPVGSASIAQVHKAIYKNGKPIAIKIKRPNLFKMIKIDFIILKGFAGIIQKFLINDRVPLIETLKDLEIAIIDQLDFRKEAENNKKFQKIFYEYEYIKIPIIYDEVCTENILVMELCTNISKFNSSIFSEREKQRVIEIGLHALYRMIFTFGFFHCDLHLSNIFVDNNDNQSIIILDTGFVSTLKPAELEIFKDFFLAIIYKDSERCSSILKKTAINRSRVFYEEQFDREIKILVEQYSNKKARNFEVSTFAYGLFEIQRKNGLKGSIAFNMAIISLLVYEGLVKSYHPNFDFQRAAIPFFSKKIMFRMLNA